MTLTERHRTVAGADCIATDDVFSIQPDHAPQRPVQGRAHSDA